MCPAEELFLLQTTEYSTDCLQGMNPCAGFQSSLSKYNFNNEPTRKKKNLTSILHAALFSISQTNSCIYSLKDTWGQIVRLNFIVFYKCLIPTSTAPLHLIWANTSVTIVYSYELTHLKTIETDWKTGYKCSYNTKKGGLVTGSNLIQTYIYFGN